MDRLLQHDKDNISAILSRTFDEAEKYLAQIDEVPPGRLVEDIDLRKLPENGLGAERTLEFFSKNYADKVIATSGPRYFGFVTGGSTPASIAGDWLVSVYDQNACGSNDSIAPQIENQTIGFLRDLFGLDNTFFGSFVTGATMSNFVGLALGRQWIGEQSGIDFSNEGLGQLPIKVLSGTPHSTIIKSMSMLGIGRNALVKIKIQEGREAVDLADLEHQLKLINSPVIVVANAGTVNTVDFDDLEAIAKLKSKYNFWLHVDAAFGGFAAASDRYSKLLKGINAADSICVDAHKWLNVPYEAAMQFTRHKSLQLKIFQNSGSYLSDPNTSPDFFHYTPETSRRWRALPSWFGLVAYGKQGLRDIVERNCEAAFHFGKLLSSSSDFKLLAPVRMNVVCFTLADENISPESIRKFLAEVRDDGRVFFTPTVFKGIPAIRAAISNWRTEINDIEIAFEVLQK